jgi:hypothetical protein
MLAAALVLLLGLTTPHFGKPAPEAATCEWPTAPSPVREDGAAVLLKWEMPYSPDLFGPELPEDLGYSEYRAAVRAAGADLRHPVTDDPPPRSQLEADERENWDLARRGEVGRIDPITCLDALLFAYQHRRVSQLTSPTEFLASVLLRETPDGVRVAVVFGAGTEMFPPKSVYGFDVIEELVGDGWEYWYAIHNHTLQSNGDAIALGNPTLSTSDVQLTRGLMRDLGLRFARVTNGVFTFSASPEDVARMRSR